MRFRQRSGVEREDREADRQRVAQPEEKGKQTSRRPKEEEEDQDVAGIPSSRDFFSNSFGMLGDKSAVIPVFQWDLQEEAEQDLS